jgi:peptidyl-prolyl cis-trans isomerase C
MVPSALASRRRPTLVATGAAILVAAAGFAYAQAPAGDPVIAKVNGVEIHQSDLALAEEDIGDQFAQEAPPAKRQALVAYLSDLIILSKAADASKIGEDGDFKKREMYSHNKLLARKYLQLGTELALTDTALHKLYDELSAEIEVRPRHILFLVKDPTDEKADNAARAKATAALDRVRKGEDFAKVASELTEDVSSKDSGGDLGYFTKGELVPEFGDVAFKLGKGQTSDHPVKTEFGWHVIKIEDARKRYAQMPEFEKVKDQLSNFAFQKARSEIIKKLRTGAEIEYPDTSHSDKTK